MSKRDISISTEGQWARGIVFTYIDGKLSVRDDLIEFTRTDGKVMFSFPIVDIKRVMFRSDRSMVMKTDHGNYTCLPYTPEHIFSTLNLFGYLNITSFYWIRRNQKKGLPIAKQWKEVFDQYGIPTNNPVIHALDRLTTIYILAFWFALAMLAVLIIGWIVDLFRG